MERPNLSRKDMHTLISNTEETVAKGCKECGHEQIEFTAAISVEPKTKVFFLDITCPKCDVEYKDIMMIEEVP